MTTKKHHYYSKMRLSDDPYAETSHNPGNYNDDMEAAQKKLEELRARKEQLDTAKRKAEEIERRKADFIEDQNFIGEQLYIASDKLEMELESMRSEMAELEQIRNCFKRDLATLGSIQAESWAAESMEQQLTRAIEVLDNCNADYNDAVDHCMQMKHSRALTRTKRKKNALLIGAGDFFRQFQQGLAFHIPLAILIALILLIYSCRSNL